MSRDSFLLLEPHFRSLLTLQSPHLAFLPTAVILKCPLSGVLRSMSGSLLMPQSMLRSSFLSVPSRLTCTLLSSRKLGLSHLFFQVIVVVRDLPLERVWVVVNLLSVMVKSPLPNFLPFQVISRSLPLPVLAILNPLNLAPAWLTFISREVPGLSKSTSTSCMPGRSLPRRAGRNTWNLYGFWLVEISTLATLLPSLSILALA